MKLKSGFLSLLIFLIVLLIPSVALASGTLYVGATYDVNNNDKSTLSSGGNTFVATNSTTPAATVASIVNTLNSGGNVVVVGGTGGTVLSTMVQSAINQAKSGSGGTITVVAGIDRDQTKNMLSTYISGGNPATILTAGSPQNPGTVTTYGYPTGFTGTSYTNYGKTTSSGVVGEGNYTYGYLTLTLPKAPVYVAEPEIVPPPPYPVVYSNINTHIAVPGQTVTIEITDKYACDSGRVYDGLGFNSTFTTVPKTVSYTVSSSALIGSTIDLKVVGTNAWYADRLSDIHIVQVMNPINITAEADPSTLAPTESTALDVKTTGYVSQVTALGRGIETEVTNRNTVATGNTFSLIRKDDGTVYSIGNNFSGDLGLGLADEGYSVNVPTKITSLDKISKVVANDHSAMVVSYNGDVYGWGANDAGQLGDGTTINKNTPVKIPGLSGIVDIGLGRDFAIFLKSDGTVLGCGSDALGNLGGIGNRLSPTVIPGLSNINYISVNSAVNWGNPSSGVIFARDANGIVKAWGGSYPSFWTADFTYYANYTTVKTPVEIPRLRNAKDIIASGSCTVAILEDGSTLIGKLSPFATDDSYWTRDTSLTLKKLAAFEGGSTTTSGSCFFGNILGVEENGGLVYLGEEYTISGGRLYTREYKLPIAGTTGIKDISAHKRHLIYSAQDGTVWGYGAEVYTGYSYKSVGEYPPDYYTWGNYPNAPIYLSYAISNNLWYPYSVKGQLKNVNSISDNSYVVALTNGDVYSLGGTLGTGIIGSQPIRTSPYKLNGASGIVEVADGHTMGLPYCLMKNSSGSVYIAYQPSSSAGEGNPSYVTGGSYYDIGLGGNNINTNAVSANPIAYGVNKLLSGPGMMTTTGSLYSFGTERYGNTGAGNAYGMYPTIVSSSYLRTVNTVPGAQDIAFNGSDGLIFKDSHVYHWGYSGYKAYYPGYGYWQEYYRSTPTMLNINNIKLLSNNNGPLYVVKTDGTLWGLTSAINMSPYVYPDASLTPTQVVSAGTQLINAKEIKGGFYTNDNQPALIYKNNDDSYYMLNLITGTSKRLNLSNVKKIALTGIVLDNDGSVWKVNIDSDTGNTSSTAVLGVELFLTTNQVTAPSSITLTPHLPITGANNAWTGTFTVPVDAKIGSKYEVVISAKSSKAMIGGIYPISTDSVILDIANTISLSDPVSSKIKASPGETLTITIPSTGYATAVKGTSPDEAIALIPTTPIGTLPKNNIWTCNLTIPASTPAGAYVVTFVGTNKTFVNQPDSKPVYLNITVGDPPVTIVGSPTAVPDPVYSHRDGMDIVTVSAKTSGPVGRVKVSAYYSTVTNGVKQASWTTLPDMTPLDSTNWSLNYKMPGNVPHGENVIFAVSAIKDDLSYTYGAVYTSINAARYSTVTPVLSKNIAVPGETISLEGTSTDNYASYIIIKDDCESSPIKLTADNPLLSSNTWHGTYRLPNYAMIGKPVLLTFTPVDVVNNSTFFGTPTTVIITVANTPAIDNIVFNQTSPYPGVSTGAPTGIVDAIVYTSGYVTSLQVGWDTNYDIGATSFVDLDNAGHRQWTIKGLTVPLNADVRNVTPTKLYAKGTTSFRDTNYQYQQVTGVGVLGIDNTIKITANQLSNPAVNSSQNITVTVTSTGYAATMVGKNINGVLFQLNPTTTVSPTSIPFTNTWTATVQIPSVAAGVYSMQFYGVNGYFTNQPNSNYDYITLAVGGISTILSASLNPYDIYFPITTDAERTISLTSSTIGSCYGVGVSVSVNGGAYEPLPNTTMTKQSGTLPSIQNFTGSYLVDSSTDDGTTLKFKFQGLDNSNKPVGNSITLNPVTIHRNDKKPKIIITH